MSSLGAPAHQWIEHFFWQWFVEGSKAKSDFTDFFRQWRAMIEFALANPLLDHEKDWYYEIDSMVYEARISRTDA